METTLFQLIKNNATEVYWPCGDEVNDWGIANQDKCKDQSRAHKTILFIIILLNFLLQI